MELAVESTPYKMHTPSPRFGEGLSRKVAGNFSTLSVTVTLNRYVGSVVHLNFNIIYVTFTLSRFIGSIVTLKSQPQYTQCNLHSNRYTRLENLAWSHSVF